MNSTDAATEVRSLPPYFDRCTAGFSLSCLAAERLCAVLISAMWVKRLREIAGLAPGA